MPDNYPEAAGKHVHDAGVLLSHSRFDGAGYLAGYAVECILKTIIQVEHGPYPRNRHDLGKLSLAATRLAGASTQRTARYIGQPGVTTMQYGLPSGWHTDLRYEAPGTVGDAAARAWVQEASRLYTEVIVAMKLDGVIP